MLTFLALASLAITPVQAEDLCSNLDYDHYQIETKTETGGRIQFTYCSTHGARHCTRIGRKEWYKRAELESAFQGWVLKRPDVQIYVGPTETESLGVKTLSMLSLGSNRVGYKGVDALPLRERDPEGGRILALGSALSPSTPEGACRRFNASSDAIRRALEEALSRATVPGPRSNLLRP